VASRASAKPGSGPEPGSERKDRLIQTRVAQDLEATLKHEARRQRLSVSQLIRNVLEDAFDLVDDVVCDVDQIVSDSVHLARNVGRNARRIVGSRWREEAPRRPDTPRLHGSLRRSTGRPRVALCHVCRGAVALAPHPSQARAPSGLRVSAGGHHLAGSAWYECFVPKQHPTGSSRLRGVVALAAAFAALSFVQPGPVLANDFDEELARIDQALRSNPNRVGRRALDSCLSRRNAAVKLANAGYSVRAERRLKRCRGLLLLSDSVEKTDTGPTMEEIQARAARELESALALEPNIKNGLEIYRECAACHMPEGWGLANGLVPQIAGQHRKVVIKQLADIRAGNRDAYLMLPYATAESVGGPQGVADVAGYIDTLEINPRTKKGPGTDLELGKQIYDENCASCHGANGEGDNDRFIPRIHAWQAAQREPGDGEADPGLRGAADPGRAGLRLPARAPGGAGGARGLAEPRLRGLRRAALGCVACPLRIPCTSVTKAREPPLHSQEYFSRCALGSSWPYSAAAWGSDPRHSSRASPMRAFPALACTRRPTRWPVRAIPAR
jgi:cytochrome c553